MTKEFRTTPVNTFFVADAGMNLEQAVRRIFLKRAKRQTR
jgi:hypothetical protein